MFQRPVQTAFGPADFLISGTFHDAYLRAMPVPGHLPPHRAPIVTAQDTRYLAQHAQQIIWLLWRATWHLQ